VKDRRTPQLVVLAGGRSDADQPHTPVRELYSRYGGAVYGRCRYLLKDPTAAEDAMQDVL
jgi:DNA-directed RNA polymerase specialized sigma24 family protein